MITELFPYIISFVISILSAYIFWRWNRFIYRPKIEIGDEIALTFDNDDINNQIPVFRLKIKNISSYDAFSIKTILRIRYQNKYLSIELPFVPVLYGNRNAATNDDKERELPFRLSQIKKGRIVSLNNPVLLEKYEKGTLMFKDFESDEAVVEVILSASDNIAGIILNKTIPPVHIKDFIKKIKIGSFTKGLMTISSEGACEYGDNY